MSHSDFNYLMGSINALSPEQMRQLFRELETKIAGAEKQPVAHGQGSLGAMRDADDDLDEAVEHAMQLRQRAWRLPNSA
jgi:hypothetical protein